MATRDLTLRTLEQDKKALRLNQKPEPEIVHTGVSASNMHNSSTADEEPIGLPQQKSNLLFVTLGTLTLIGSLSYLVYLLFIKPPTA